MQCAAVRGCHEERERRERAIPLVFLRPQLVSRMYIRGWARAELGSTFEPCHVAGCFEHAKTLTEID